MTAGALLLALAALAAGAPPPRAALARAERGEVRLGEPFGYEIEVRHAPAESVAIAPELDVPPFRGTGGACRRAGEERGEARTVCSMTLALFALGPHDVPELRLEIAADGRAEALLVPGPRVAGVGIVDPSAPPGSLALRDPAPPVPLLVPTLRVLAWAAGAAALGAALLLARRAWRARRRAAAEAAAPPVHPALRLAQRLDALEVGGLGTPAAVAGVSAAVREWAGAVAAIPALDLTTAELGERLARAAVPGLDAAALARLCAEADLVKFARAPVDAARWAEWSRWARGAAAAVAAASPTPTPTATPSVHPERSAWRSRARSRRATSTATPTSTSSPTPTPTSTSTSTATATANPDPDRERPR